MRKPQRAPDLPMIHELLSRDPERAARILAVSSDPSLRDEYHHWDALRRRPAPAGLNHEDWWFALKIRREMGYEPVLLLDPAGHPFKYAITSSILELLSEIERRTAGMIAMPEQITNPDTRDHYVMASLIQEATTSSQLEGAATTRRVADEMLRSNRKPRDRGERMIYNNFHTMRRIAELKDEPLSDQLVVEIHRLITERTLTNETDEGRFRRSNEVITVQDEEGEILHIPPPADQLNDRMRAMCDFANAKTPDRYVHPTIRSILLHFWLAYDHPFVDGNGRTARALFYWSMLHHGYWLMEYVSISQTLLKAPGQYAKAFLYTETDDNDATYFILYQLNIIKRSIDALEEYIKRKTIEVRNAEKQLKHNLDLNHRQRTLLNHALRHPGFRYTVEGHRAYHDVVYETSRSDLLELVDRGFLESLKEGKKWYFTAPRDIDDRLSMRSNEETDRQ